MSVVVRMEMPKGCLDCPCVNGEYGYCQADKEERQIEDPNGRPSWCPIICSLPDGHGRLVDSEEDASKYITVWDCNCSEFGRQTVMAVEYLQYLPIIVPAERSET